MESVTYCTIKLSVCKQLVAMGTKTISLFRFHQYNVCLATKYSYVRRINTNQLTYLLKRSDITNVRETHYIF